MKFRFYITDINDGSITGSNDEDKCRSFAESEDFFIVDSENGEWLQPDGESEKIQENKI